MRKVIIILCLSVLLFNQHLAHAGTFSVPITFYPTTLTQGDPLMVTIDAKQSSLSKVFFDGKAVSIFTYDGKTRAFIPISLTARAGTHSILVKSIKGEGLTKDVVVNKRKKFEAPLGIPAKLGGDTVQSQKRLVSNLDKENASLIGLRTSNKVLWMKPFIFPVKDPIVTDGYGYNRKTGEYTIAHKGTDFRAPTSTSVLAMNDGIVRLAHTYIIYGNTIVIDHGLGLQTFYMHLSKINVKEGQSIKRGDVIGLSGDTGYAESPHLHTTVRLSDISIDPIVFMNFFKK